MMLHHDDIAIYDAANTAGSMWGFDVDPQPEPDVWLKEGDTISFGNLTITVMHTPGHSPAASVSTVTGCLFQEIPCLPARLAARSSGRQLCDTETVIPTPDGSAGRDECLCRSWRELHHRP